MNKELKTLTEKQELTKILKDFDDCILCDDEGGMERRLEIYLPKIMKIIAKIRKESIEYERERILKDIEKFHKTQWETNHNMIVNISLVNLIDYLECVDIKKKS